MSEKRFYETNSGAEHKTVKGWFDTNGRFWGENEHMAKVCSATHKHCDNCGAEIGIKGHCQPCREQNRTNEFKSYPVLAWDGVTPIAIFDTDEYFFDTQSFLDYLESEDIKAQDLELVLCTPNYMRQIDTDYWEDDLPDSDASFIPAEVKKLLDELNEVIGFENHVLSWSQSKVRVDVSGLFKV